MPDPDFSQLRALIVNCTLKPSPQPSNTAALAANAVAIMRTHGVVVDEIRAVDHVIPPGVDTDMTEHGAERDDWPAIQARVMEADILIVATPIWLGEKSSVCTRVIERLYGYSGQLNAKGQWAYYGRVGGVVVTGNEDGIKHVAMNVLYSLQHLGYTIPPQADAGCASATPGRRRRGAGSASGAHPPPTGPAGHPRPERRAAAEHRFPGPTNVAPTTTRRAVSMTSCAVPCTPLPASAPAAVEPMS